MSEFTSYGNVSFGLSSRFDQPIGPVGDLFFKGMSHMERMEIDQAIGCYRSALEIDPDDPQVKYQLSQALLLIGDFDEGLPLFESRFQAVQSCWTHKRQYPFEDWTGEDLNGKTMLLYNEQGYGDLIFYSRWFPELKEQFHACKLVLMLPYAMYDRENRDSEESYVLFDDTSIDEYVFDSCQTNQIQADCCCSVGSLPYFTKTLIDGEAPYISAREHKPHIADDTFKIGFTFHGSRFQGGELDKRCADPSIFLPLTTLPNTSVVSLNREMPYLPVESPFIYNFIETAEWMSELDLFISVDTANIHLAGSMGVNTVLLLPELCDWRYGLGLNQSWYPSVSLIRCDWKQSIEVITETLRQSFSLTESVM